MAGLGSFNPAAATKNLQALAQKTGRPLGPKPAPVQAPRNIGPWKAGYGPQPKATPPRTFSQGLSSVTKQNYQAGAAARQYASEGRPVPFKLAQEESEEKGGVGKGWVPVGVHGGSRAEHTGTQIGIALPAGLPGLKFLLGSAVAAKGVNEAVGNVSGKSLSGKLYNEALQIGMGGPRASVEAVEHPGAFAKGMANLITHPIEHPLGAALTFGGVLRGADIAAGKVAGVSTERAPSMVSALDQTAVPRSYSQGLVENAAQKGITKAQQAAGIDPNLLRTRSIPLYGSKVKKAIIGGTVKPGLTDIHRGNQNVVADLQAAKGHEFVEANRPAAVLRDAGVLSRSQAKGDIGKAHDEAVMPFHEGYARTPETYWEDVAKREGRLLQEHPKITDPVALDRNQAQIDQLRLVKEHQDSINKVGLNFHEAAARKIADSQSHSFHSELLEGHLHPDQFNARLIGFGLEHGDLLGRGQLHYEQNPGKDPIVARVGELKQQHGNAVRAVQQAKEKLAQATGEAKREKARAPAGLKGSRLAIASRHTETLAEAQAMEADLRKQVQEGQKEIAHRKANGYMDHEGNSWHGLYDEAGQRVSGQELREFYAMETSGQHGQPTPRGSWQAPNEVPLHELKPNLKADTPVKIYRVTSDREIKPGKGVLLEPPTHHFAPHMHVESDIVPASHVFGDRNAPINRFGMQEYGYHPSAAQEPVIGGREPGFITHREENVPTAKGQYIGGGARPGTVARSRTGEHAMSGNYRNDFGTLHREFRRSARNLSRYRSENQLIEQFGIQQHVLDGIDHNLPPQAQHAQMVELARELNASPAKRDQALKGQLGEWVVHTRGPDRVLNSPNIHDSRFSTMNQVGRAEGKATLEKPGELKYTLIRKGVLDRLESHLAAERPTSPIIKAMKQLTGYQRHVALYSSPRWPVGVTQENMIRLAAQNTNPLVAVSRRLAESSRAYKAGKGYLEGLNKVAGDDLRKVAEDPGRSVPEKTMARTNAGMLEHGSMIGSEIRSMMNDGRSINQDLIDQLPPTFSDNVAGTLGVKQGLAAWNDWKQFLGNHLTNMENRTRIALAGHQLISEYGTFSKEIKGLIAKEDAIVKQVTENKLDPVAATRFTEQLLDAAGNWSHLTPFTREMRTWMAPFGLWWLNSAKFMFKTMPMDHPLKTALWSALVSATKPDERAEFKQGSIHVNMPGVGPVDFSPIHYSTADIFHEWEKTGQSMVMPWFTEAFERSAGINNLYNQSIYGKEETEGKSPANVKAAAEQMGLSFLPFSNLATSFIREGGTPNEKGPFPLLEAKAGTQKGLLRTAVKNATPFPFTYGTKREAEERAGSKTERLKPEREKVSRGRVERVKPER